VVYRVLTGRAPFANCGPRALHAVVFDSPARPSRIAPSISRDVERVLALALAKKPEDRFARASDFARALHAATTGALDSALRLRADALVLARPWAS
jgi:serine/threonine-protein kinase